MLRKITTILENSIAVKRQVIDNNVEAIQNVIRAVLATFRKGGKVILFGNGGSAADAQHIAAELIGRFKMKRKSLPALALSTNSSSLTALANDYDWETVFQRQVEAFAAAGDTVIGLTTSGNSANVIEALKAARAKGAVAIVLTGDKHENLDKVADIVLAVPSNDTPRIQEAHITIGHVICEIVERELFRP